MEDVRKQFKEMLKDGLEDQIRETAKSGYISNWKDATIIPVIGFIPSVTSEAFIAGAFLLGQDEDGEAELLCTEPSDEQYPAGVIEWKTKMMQMEGIRDGESICELLLDFQMAVVANDFDFNDAKLNGWESIFEQIRNHERSTNRRSLATIAEMGQIRDALKELLSNFLGDLAEGIDNWQEKLNPDAINIASKDFNEDGTFSTEFTGEWA
tara:strand:- start:4979 stop:5608 length:630 start_codon:yes stop_codon:yes gene_type:complete